MITVKRSLNVKREARGQRRVEKAKSEMPRVEEGRIPRISRLMALAIRLDRLIQEGVASDQSELARLARVTQPRMTQILNLLHLAPDIQEELLFLPRVTAGKATVHEHMLRPIAAEVSWRKQREMWVHVHPSRQGNAPDQPVSTRRNQVRLRSESRSM